MYYQEFRKVAKEYSKTFEYSFSISSLKSKMLWLSVLSLATMSFFFVLSIKKQPPISANYAFWAAMLSEALAIVFYAIHSDRRKKTRQIELGVFDPERDKYRHPLEIKAEWLAERIPYSREQYADLVDALEKIEARLNNKIHKINLMEAYIKSILTWTRRTRSIATLVFIPVAIYTIQALLEDKTWARPLKLTMTAENIGTAGLLALGLVVFSIIIAAFVGAIKFALDYWLDVITLHGCSEVSLARLANDLLRLSSIDPMRNTVTPTTEDQRNDS